MSWVAVGGAVVSVVGGAIANNNKPKVPGAVYQDPTSLQDEQKRALEGNLASQSSIEKLLAQSNTFQQGQALSLANQAMPGYDALSKSLTSRAQGLADHPYDVPKEVQDNLERIAAEKGISAGTRGQFNDFSLLRDFGVNQLQYGQANLSQASQITSLLSSIAPKVNPMSPLAFYVTPQQNAAQTSENNANNQATAQSAANAKAASQQANQSTWNNILNGVVGAGINYLGSSGSGSSGTGSGGAPQSSGLDLTTVGSF